MKNCIYGLIIRYNENVKLRNINICEYIPNIKDIDIIIFYESYYLSENDMNEMNENIKKYNKNILFFCVDKYFLMTTEDIQIADACISKNKQIRYRPKYTENKKHYGYMNMCYFHSYHVFKILSDMNYKFAWRMDDDIIIHKCSIDLLKKMNDENLKSVVFRKAFDLHISVLSFCNLMKNYIKNKKINQVDLNDIDHKTFYSNHYIVDVSLFLETEPLNIVNEVIEHKLFYKEYCGDDVITGNIIKIFSKKNEIYFCKNDILKYQHKSHNYDNYTSNNLPLLHQGRCGIEGQIDLWDLDVDIIKLSKLNN